MDEPPPSGDQASQARVRLREDVAWREIDGEIVLLDLTGQAYYTASRSGAVLWPSMVAGATVRQLSDLLAERFSLDRHVAERDVRDFLDTLHDEGLLDVAAV
jgi:hypothetical protein